ncbi:FAD-dependent oxidoreductase [Actinomadura chibensis]|uniref:FAD-dependent oxidoreductase n=1 Tax=Actinomadura chibensis TaxID=392828 RepID=A0A5D0NBX8_9ACTN|nr:FAD-dependent oxidoreductase [Actinomadura chibensis]TYB41837.1 FAD-dependent oxidoreductase [Actinomadura chibensis]
MSPVRRRGGHAVVIGAGIAGLAAARALSRAFTEVTVVERDRLPAEPRPRAGVPQGRHGHALAARGLRVLNELFPGLSSQLAAAGAPPADFCAQAEHLWPGGLLTATPSDVTIQPVSRPLLETVLRDRVQATDGVRVVEGRTVTGLVGDARRVTGVRLTRRGGGAATLPASLVADASGRTSRLPGWLAAIGVPAPEETSVDAGVGYATRGYRAEPEAGPGWRALFEIPHAPRLPRGCFALRVEGDLLLVTLQGAAGDHPPADEDGFDRFMKSLRSDIAAVVAPLRPVSGVVRYARSTAVRRHYHRVRPWPDGLVVLGDAACTFNPLYAQGMTVAALEARALGELLGRPSDADLTGFSRVFQRRAGRITSWPWLMSSLADRAWSETTPLVTAAHRYLTTCQDLAVDDPAMFRDLARVTNMLSGPAPLFRPRNLERLLRRHARPR